MSNVLVLTPFYPPNVGGAETFTLDLVDLFLDHGDTVTVLTYQPLTSKEHAPVYERDGRLKVIRLPWFRGRLFYRFESSPILQVIYLGTGLLVALFLMLLFTPFKRRRIIALGLAALATGFAVSLVFFWHRLDAVILTIYRFSERQGLGRIVSLFARRVRRFYCLSDASAEDLRSVPGVDNVEAFPLWINQRTRFFRRTGPEVARLVEVPDGNHVALFVGRFSPEKGILNLAEIIADAPEGWHFVVIGDGPLAREFGVRTRSEASRITRVKSVTNDMLPLYYSRADLLLFAPADRDYLGRTAIEALSCGTPVLVYNQSTYFGGEEKLVLEQDPEGGVFIIEPPLANVVAFLADHSGAETLASTRAIRKKAEAEYSVDNGRVFLDE